MTLLVISGQSFGQNILFSTRHDHLGLHFHDAATSVFPTYGNSLMVVGMCNEPNYSDQRLSISYYDSLGQFAGVHSFGGTGIEFMPNYDGASATTDGGFVAAVERLDSTGGNGQAMIWRFDSEGDSLWTRMPYPDTAISSNAAKAVQTRDGRFALVGSEYDGISSKVFLSLFDADGDLQWTHEYSGSGSWGRHAKSLDTLADGGFVIGAYRYVNGSEPDYESWVIRTDSVGNVIWQQYFPSAHGEGDPLVMAWRSDRIIVADQKWTEVDGHDPLDCCEVPSITMLDTSGAVIWERIYPALWRSVWATSLRSFNVSSFVFSSMAWQQTSDDFSATLFNVSETGDSLWHREYWTPDTACMLSALYTTSILVESEDNIVLAGQWGFCGEDHWLMRTDGEGIPPETMQLMSSVPNDPIPAIAQWQISPNPTSGEVLITCQDLGAVLKSVDLFDLSGRHLLHVEPLERDCVLNLGEYVSGIYALQLTVLNEPVQVRRLVKD